MDGYSTTVEPHGISPEGLRICSILLIVIEPHLECGYGLRTMALDLSRATN